MKRCFVSFFVALIAFARAEVGQVGSLAALRSLETQVTSVVESCTDSTISLVSPQSGASGSGVIVSSEGLILTAAHVIEGSREMTVIFPSGRQEKAKVLGANYNRDAAMAQLLGEGPWPFAKVAPSDSLEVADYVVAMGHPKGYDPTRRPPVRFGRIMAKGELDFMTTDCTLIGGDSGGPLFDLEGRVVGIHSNIGSDRQVNNHAGLSGFQKCWKKLRAGDSWGSLVGSQRDPNRPVLGVILEKTAEGMLVKEAPDGSPALEAGIVAGDLIIEVASRKVVDPENLVNLFVDFEPGEKVSLVILREGQEQKLSVTLGRLSEVYRSYRR